MRYGHRRYRQLGPNLERQHRSEQAPDAEPAHSGKATREHARTAEQQDRQESRLGCSWRRTGTIEQIQV
jgi:hypothetical protein